MEAVTVFIFCIEYALRIWTANYLYPGIHQVSGRARLEPIIAEPHILEGIQQAERVINTRSPGHEMIAVVPFP